MSVRRQQPVFVNNVRLNKRQRGLGIVEVLVALVVVSFGVLGMASLQLTGMKQSSSGFNRSKALLFAQNMASRMRINAEGAHDELYAAFSATEDTFDCNAIPVPYCQAKPGGTTVPKCTSSELATFDQFSIACGDVGTEGAKDGVLGTLPNGTLSIECLSATCEADSTYQVTVSWTEGRASSDSDEMAVRRVQVRLRP